MMSAYELRPFGRHFRVGVLKVENEFLPSSFRVFRPQLFKKVLEMIDQSESVYWENVWCILRTKWLASPRGGGNFAYDRGGDARRLA